MTRRDGHAYADVKMMRRVTYSISPGKYSHICASREKLFDGGGGGGHNTKAYNSIGVGGGYQRMLALTHTLDSKWQMMCVRLAMNA